MPNFQAVDGILPQDVTAGSSHRQGTKVCIGDPYGKGGVLLAQALAALDDGAEEVADVASHSELRQADKQRHHGDSDEEYHRRPAVDDVLHGAARDDGQRDAPHIEGQVLDGDQTLLHARQVVLDQIGTNERQHKHEKHLVHNHAKGDPETDVHPLVDEREHDGHRHHSHEVGQEHIGGHRLEVAAQLARHHGRCAGSRADDARQDALHENEVLALHVKADDKRCDEHDEQQLEHRDPQVPHRGPHLVEIHAQECREQDEAHEQRQDGVEYRLHHLAHRVEGPHPVEYQVDDRARHDGAGQGPILQKVNYGFHYGGKITKLPPTAGHRVD